MARVKTILRGCAPAMLARTRETAKRFEALNYSSVKAWRAALSPEMRDALAASRAEALPRAVRRHLGFVVDVGANEGQWLTSLLQVVPVRQALAFEPNPAACAVLRERLTGRGMVTVRELALGEEPGLLPLNITSSSDFASFLPSRAALGGHYSAESVAVTEQVNVPISTLDAEAPAATTVDLLKIDVQGFERHVLKGGVATLQRTRALLVEGNVISHYEGDDTFATLTTLLSTEYNFTCWTISPPFHSAEGRALWMDMVFVNPAFGL